VNSRDPKSKKSKLIDMSKIESIFKKAKREKFAIGQFNFSDFTQLKAIARASKELDIPALCGTSQGEASFFGKTNAVALIKKFREKEKIKLYLNFDHGKSYKELKEAVDNGYDMVHFDGSDLDFDKNIRETKKIVRYAHKKGVLVEGEVSKIGGKSALFNKKAEKFTLTSLEKIVRFIEETEVDCIALDVGNIHGVFTEMPKMELERISNLLREVSCFVVLHGGSGIQKKEIREAIDRGVVKININTEIRVEWIGAIRDFLDKNPDEIVPYKIMPEAEFAVYKKIREKMKLFINK